MLFTPRRTPPVGIRSHPALPRRSTANRTPAPAFAGEEITAVQLGTTPLYSAGRLAPAGTTHGV